MVPLPRLNVIPQEHGFEKTSKRPKLISNHAHSQKCPPRLNFILQEHGFKKISKKPKLISNHARAVKSVHQG